MPAYYQLPHWHRMNNPQAGEQRERYGRIWRTTRQAMDAGMLRACEKQDAGKLFLRRLRLSNERHGSLFLRIQCNARVSGCGAQRMATPLRFRLFETRKMNINTGEIQDFPPGVPIPPDFRPIQSRPDKRCWKCGGRGFKIKPNGKVRPCSCVRLATWAGKCEACGAIWNHLPKSDLGVCAKCGCHAVKESGRSLLKRTSGDASNQLQSRSRNENEATPV